MEVGSTVGVSTAVAELGVGGGGERGERGQRGVERRGVRGG